MNYLLTALSTFSFVDVTVDGISKKMIRKSEVEIDGQVVEYYYQLEPVPRKLLNGCSPDELTIIALATPDSMKKVAYLPGENAAEVNESPLEYMKRVFGGVQIIPIEIDVKNSTMGIINAVAKLREKMDKGKDKLYIDTHGSFRDVQNALQAIVSLLDHEGIEPEVTYDVRFDTVLKRATISENNLGLNDFVSGINEFLNTGRGHSLRKYIESTAGVSSPEDNIGELIQDISNSIMLCDMTAFDAAVDKMAKMIECRKGKKAGDYVDLFLEYISSDYGVLLDAQVRKLTDKIEWCIKKDFIQQALSIIESQMPHVIVGSKFFDVDWNKTLTGDSYDEIAKRYIKGTNPDDDMSLTDVVNTVKTAKNMEWEESNNYLLRTWAEKQKTNIMEHDSSNKIVYVDLDGKLANNGWRRLIPKDAPRYGYFNLMCNGLIYSTIINCAERNDYKKREFKLFMQLHMTIKSQRNMANHAVSGRKTGFNEIKDALIAYIEMAKILGF